MRTSRAVAAACLVVFAAACAAVGQQLDVTNVGGCVRKNCKDPEAAAYQSCEAACRSREASARRCSSSSGGSCTTKSTPSIATRSASHLRSSSPVRYSQVCASIGWTVPQWAGTRPAISSAQARSVSTASKRFGAEVMLCSTYAAASFAGSLRGMKRAHSGAV